MKGMNEVESGFWKLELKEKNETDVSGRGPSCRVSFLLCCSSSSFTRTTGMHTRWWCECISVHFQMYVF